MKLLIKFYTINHFHYHHLVPLTKQTVKDSLLSHLGISEHSIGDSIGVRDRLFFPPHLDLLSVQKLLMVGTPATKVKEGSWFP